MKKIKLLGAIALFAFGLTACDKADPVAEFKQFQAWSNTQSAAQQKASAVLQQQMATAVENKDKKALEAALDTYKNELKNNLESLDKLDVKSDEVKMLKEKTKALLAVSSDLMADTAHYIEAQTPELQKAIQDKTAQIQTLATEQSKLNKELEQKFNKQ